MSFPPFLQQGDRIALVSAAGKIDQALVERGAAILAEEGFVPLIGPNAFAQSGPFAGDDTLRAADLQWALDHPDIKAVIFSRGGYGSLRTHQLIDWRKFIRHPKWLVGFSDITVFHAFVNKQKIASIHGVMPAFFESGGQLTGSYREMIDLLTGTLPDFSIEPHPLNRTGEATGILAGGNLSIIQSLRGTPLDFDPRGMILFLEDIAEYNYHIDRMMMNLKSGKVLEKIAGLVVGYFTDMKEGETPFGKEACAIIREAVESYRYPVLFGFPAGHELPNRPLLLGGKFTMEVTSRTARLRSSVE